MVRSFWNRFVKPRDTVRGLVSPSRRARLSLHSLEDRTVPTLVTSLADPLGLTPGTLRWAVAAASTTDHIVTFDPSLSAGGTISLNPALGQIAVTGGDVAIDGVGQSTLVIDAGGNSRAFYVGSGVKLTLDDLTITNGKATLETYPVSGGGTIQYAFGGAIRSNGSLELNRVTVSNSQAADAGGAIDANSPSGSGSTLLLVDSTITGNSITGVTNPGQQGFGGGINSNVSTTLIGTTVSYNTALTGGGGVDAFGNTPGTTFLNIQGGSFAYNLTATGYGDGIATTNVTSITPDTRSGTAVGTVFDHNGNGMGYGGAALDYFISGSVNTVGSSLTIDGATFSNNAAQTGGAVYVNVSNVRAGTFTVDITNSTFTGNTAIDPRGSSAYGGGLNVFNTSTGSGGTSATVVTTISDSTFTGNTASKGGGLALTATASNGSSNTITASGLTVDGNTATALFSASASNYTGGFGGGITISATSNSGGTTNVAVRDSAITNNTAQNSNTTYTNQTAQGGGVSVAVTGTSGSTTVDLARLTVSGNDATATNGEGGGVFVLSTNGSTASGTATVNLTASTIDHNTASTSGGGVMVDASRAAAGTVNVDLTNDTIAFNSAQVGGGLFFRGLSGTSTAAFNADLTSLTVAYNDAALGAGGVYVDATFPAPTVRNSLIAVNTAPVAPDVFGTVNSAGYNLVGDGTGSTGFTGTGDQVGVNPLLAPALANNGGPTETLAFVGLSPAIGAGDPTLVGTTDQRGYTRANPTTIGAYDPNGT